ncbi:MAG: hypothetical protein NT165_00295 [Candidatus Falkowbacteria bacterium]|nr:hypothetical protein [Candidatus Falkowbacteria bacterium]
MKQNKQTSGSPFLATQVFGHNPFEYRGGVYRFNPTVVTAGVAESMLTKDEISLMMSKDINFIGLPKEQPVIVVIIDRVHNEVPLEKKSKPEEANEISKWQVELNGVQFERQYYHHFLKEYFEKLVYFLAEGKCPDELEIEDFLFLFSINFFSQYLISPGGRLISPWEKARFFQKVYKEINAFEYALIAHKLPGGREQIHFILWEK